METTILPIVGKEYPLVVTELINQAKNSIKIIVFDWRWYPNDPASPAQIFNNSILQAHKRGCEVKAICNMPDIVATLKPEGLKIKNITTKRLVHAKMIIIDNKHVIIGSHNFSQNAFSQNYEFSVVIANTPNIERYTEFFDFLYQTA